MGKLAVGKKAVAISMTVDKYKELKKLSVDLGITLSEMMVKATDENRKYNREQINLWVGEKFGGNTPQIKVPVFNAICQFLQEHGLFSG